MIKEIIYEYWRAPLPSVKKRDFDLHLIDSDLVNDIVGTRRSGKTYLMFYIIHYLLESKKLDKKTTLYINFENRRLYPLKEEYFNQIVEFVYAEGLLDKFKRIYLFLDEIQNIENWHRWVRSIYDEFKGRMKIFISGSNEKLLEKEYSRLLTGRHITVNVSPLSFEEYLCFNNIFVDRKQPLLEKERSIIKKQLGGYIKHGGFPEVVLSAQTQKEAILQQYFTDIITRDVLFREKLRKSISVIEDFGAYLINNIAQLTSFRRLTKFFASKGTKMSVPTLERYYQLFEDAFLFFSSRIFSYRIKDQLQHPKKIYCIDTGLINAMRLKFSPDSGKLYENIVAVELRRRKQDIYYWKDSQHREVDFVVRNGLKIVQLIQVCFDIENTQTQEREIRALLKASDELRCKNLLMITENSEETHVHQGKKIIYVPLWKWLLKSF